jgi:CheY-like chemotaxis protein
VKALVIEDDQDVANYLVKGLKESDFVVDHAADGKEGMMMAASEDYDIMIVDRMLPGMDGLSIIKTVRATGNQVPVLILSALGDVDDRVEGLRGGGDDYLTKPFSFTELLPVSNPWCAVIASLRKPRPCCGWQIWKWTCLPEPLSGPGTTLMFSPGSSVCWNISCEMPGRWSLVPCCSKKYGTIISTPRPTSSTYTSAV